MRRTTAPNRQLANTLGLTSSDASLQKKPRASTLPRWTSCRSRSSCRKVMISPPKKHLGGRVHDEDLVLARTQCQNGAVGSKLRVLDRRVGLDDAHRRVAAHDADFSSRALQQPQTRNLMTASVRFHAERGCAARQMQRRALLHAPPARRA